MKSGRKIRGANEMNDLLILQRKSIITYGWSPAEDFEKRVNESSCVI